MMQAVLDALEQPYHQLARKQTAADQVVHSWERSSLQSATALRHLLHPARLLPPAHEASSIT